jgi:hypothetical protein
VTTNPIVKWVVRGPVRGTISSHRTLSAAHKAVQRDRNACASLGGGAYSDASAYAVHKDVAVTGPYDPED